MAGNYSNPQLGEAMMTFVHELKFAVRSLARTKGLDR